jgi:hypothetical protein
MDYLHQFLLHHHLLMLFLLVFLVQNLKLLLQLLCKLMGYQPHLHHQLQLRMEKIHKLKLKYKIYNHLLHLHHLCL